MLFSKRRTTHPSNNEYAEPATYESLKAAQTIFQKHQEEDGGATSIASPTPTQNTRAAHMNAPTAHTNSPLLHTTAMSDSRHLRPTRRPYKTTTTPQQTRGSGSKVSVPQLQAAQMAAALAHKQAISNREKDASPPSNTIKRSVSPLYHARSSNNNKVNNNRSQESIKSTPNWETIQAPIPSHHHSHTQHIEPHLNRPPIPPTVIRRRPPRTDTQSLNSIPLEDYHFCLLYTSRCV